MIYLQQAETGVGLLQYVDTYDLNRMPYAELINTCQAI
jgi:hypothetical protein